jgi:transcriptional regulator with XRE-family HTH domain
MSENDKILSSMVREARRRVWSSIEAAAPHLGVHHRTLATYERGERLPDVDFLAHLAHRTGADFAALVRARLADSGIVGVDLALAVGALRPAPAAASSEDMVMVPLYKVSAAAGGGAVVEREEVETEIAFRADWLHNVLGVERARLAVIRAVGESMSPTIEGGDALLVELEPGRLVEGGVYVFATDGELMVKRPQRLADGSLLLRSDNPGYAPVTYTPERAIGLRAVARVRWIGRML